MIKIIFFFFTLINLSLANASTNIFRIDNEHGAHCFTIYMTGSNSGNSVSKIYHVACKYGATPTINSAVSASIL